MSSYLHRSVTLRSITFYNMFDGATLLGISFTESFFGVTNQDESEGETVNASAMLSARVFPQVDRAFGYLDDTPFDIARPVRFNAITAESLNTFAQVSPVGTF